MTVYRRRRRGAFFAAALAILFALAALASASRSPSEARQGRSPGHNSASPVSWPSQGQAALVLGSGPVTAGPNQHRAPIASLAKVMTAYLVLEHDPLSGEEEGFTVTVSPAQAHATAEEASHGQSVVPVRPGEQLTERELLEALLVPSGNNIARILATDIAGSETRFVAEMNEQARALGMNDTVYTDPSGFRLGTVSTASDQLRIFQRAIGFSVFAQIVSMATVTLPVVGTVRNYDPLIAQGYDGKTGSDSAAEGCLAFFTHVTVAGRPLTAVGVVMGQGEGDDTAAILAAAGRAAQQIVDSVAQSGEAGPAVPGGPGAERRRRSVSPPLEPT